MASNPGELLARAIGGSTGLVDGEPTQSTVLVDGRPARSKVEVYLNGRHATAALRLNSSWPSQLQALAPHARRISLWSEDGHEVLWWERGRTSGLTTPCVGCERLYLVTEHHPFVWPLSSNKRRVRTADGGEYSLRTLSVRPRVLLAEGILASAELEAIRRLAAPRLRRSKTDWSLFSSLSRLFTPARPAHRTSSNAWLTLSSGDEARGDEAHVRAASARLASLVRLPMAQAEPMQVVHYNTSQYYWYHLDNAQGGVSHAGGTPSRRAITALFYLNDDFSGGHTNFPMASRGAQPMRDARKVLQTYTACQTARGLSVKPKLGDVLLFYNTQPNSRLDDPWPWHGSCAVTAGEKWAANLWFQDSVAGAALGARPRRSGA